MEKSDYVVNNLYQPGYSSFKPGSGDSPMHSKGFNVPASEMGITVNPGVANQLAELNKALNQGVVPVELGTISWDLWESIPEEHFHEMRRKAALAEAKLSIHAPIQGMDPSGFRSGEGGSGGWDAAQQQLVENQLKDVVNKASIIDSSGNMPITIHGSNYAGSTWKYAINPKTGKREKMYDQMVAVDKVTGQAVQIKQETMFQPGDNLKEGSMMTAEEGLVSRNNAQWRKEIDEVVYKNEDAFKTLKTINPAWQEVVQKVRYTDTNIADLKNTEKEIYYGLKNAEAHVKDAELGVNSLFNKAVEYCQEDKDKMEKIQRLSDQYAKQTYAMSQDEFSKLGKDEQEFVWNKQHDIHNKSEAIQNLAEGLREVRPEMYETVESFSIKKASETFANVAKYSYDKNGEGAPIMSIENLDQGRMGFSNGEDLAKLSQTSREKLAGKLMDEGKSLTEANKIAEKMIGVTFDVGHLNISRKYGFEKEDLVKEAALLKEHVKHIHLTDNFGYADSHLPIGMGNVPVNELLEALGDKGKEARKINEVGGWYQISQESPFPHLLQASGSQIYSSGTGPGWDQSLGFQQSYSQGGGMMLPSTHYSMFGAGFSQLPTELGGSVQGAGGQGRMGGGGF